MARDVSGMYQCEISEDAPIFHTDIRQARMQVVELPSDNPTLSIMKRVLGQTDSLKAHCKAGVSHPSANITWFINGKRVRFDLTPTFYDIFPNIFLILVYVRKTYVYPHYCPFSKFQTSNV